MNWEKIYWWLHENGDMVVNTFIGFLIGIFLCACLFGCKTKIVTVTEYKERHIHDTTQVVDSVWRDRWHTEYLHGDTLYLRDSVFVYKYKYLDKIKETYIHDSIPYEVEVQVPVRVRSGYDKFCSWAFWIIVVLIILRVAWWAFKKFYLHK